MLAEYCYICDVVSRAERFCDGDGTYRYGKYHIDKKKMEFHEYMSIVALIVLIFEILLCCLNYLLKIEDEEEEEDELDQENFFPYHPRTHG